jgi:hypothetical protein
MSSSADLNLFLEKIMRINVLRMGGASAGIFGSPGADSDVAYNLKKTALAFASEYCKPAADQTVLDRLSNEVYGCLQTLQLTYVLSEETANELAGQLQDLLA